MSRLLPILASDPQTVQVGRPMGLLILAAVGLVVAVKCVRIARREEAQGICVISLGCLFASWGIFAIGTFIERHLDGPPALVSVFRTVAIGLFLATPILAVPGLVLYRIRRERYRVGRAYAIWALSILLGLVAVVVASDLAGQAGWWRFGE
jgi:hypothetical protein